MRKLFRKMRNWLDLGFRPKETSYNPANEYCPECGYYCLGHGGFWCIDKPSMRDNS